MVSESLPLYPLNFAIINPLTRFHHVTSARQPPHSGLSATSNSALDIKSVTKSSSQDVGCILCFYLLRLFWKAITIYARIHCCCEEDNPIYNSI